MSSKGKLLKANPLSEENEHQAELASESSLATFRPLTSNMTEVATYYSKWFQNIVK